MPALVVLGLPVWSAAAVASPQQILDAGLVVLVRTAGGEVGSGIVVGANEVATSCSVLAGAASITVHETWKQPAARPTEGVPAILAARDANGLACLLYLEAPFWRAPPVEFAPVSRSDAAAAGDGRHPQVFAVGVSEGHILTVRRAFVGTSPADSRAAAARASDPDPWPAADRSAPRLSEAGTALFDERGRLVAMVALLSPASGRSDSGKADGKEAPTPQGVPAADIAALLESSAEWRACLLSPTPDCVLDEAERAAFGQVWLAGTVATARKDVGDHEGARVFLRASLDRMLSSGRVVPRGLLAAAMDLIEAGDETAALKALQAAKAAADEVWNDDLYGRLNFFEGLASGLVKVGAAGVADDLAEEALRLVSADGDRDRTLGAAAMVQFHAGQVAEALGTVRTIDDPESRRYRLGAMRGALLDAGELDAALWTADQVGEPEYRTAVERGVAVALAGRGEAEMALRMVDQSTDPAARDSLQGTVTTALVEAGELEAALDLVRQMDDSWSRLSLLGSIAVAQAEAGDFETALSTAEVLRHPNAKAPDYDTGVNTCEAKAYCRTVASIAGAMAAAGEIPAARAAVARLESPLERLLVLATVATREEARGDPAVGADLSELVDSVAVHHRRDLEDIAVAQSSAGDTLGMEHTLERLASSPWEPRSRTEIDDPALKWLKTDGVLTRIARAEAGAGDFDAALRTASRVGHGFSRLRLFHEVAEAQAGAGDTVAAQATFGTAVSLFERLNRARIRPCCAGTHPLVWAVEAMTHAEARAGFGAETLESLGALELTERRGFSLQKIVHAASSRGEFGLALRAQSVMGGYGRVEAFGYIARALAGLPPGELPWRID